MYLQLYIIILFILKITTVYHQTYFLQDIMLLEMVPFFYMDVMNNRQVRNLIELSKTHMVCLCVSNQCHKEIRIDYNVDVSDDGTSFLMKILLKG